MCKAICPQCGFEFEAKSPAPIVNARWTAEEDATLLRLYQNERKTIPQIAEEMNRTQDAVRNHLHALRGAGKHLPMAQKLAAASTDEHRRAEYHRLQERQRNGLGVARQHNGTTQRRTNKNAKPHIPRLGKRYGGTMGVKP